MNIFRKIKSLRTVIKDLTSHPLNQDSKLAAVKRLVKWQIGIRLNPYPVIYPFTDKSKLIIKKGAAGATGNLYSGLHEYSDMAFVLHFLRPEDLFADIGANVGSFTVLASGHVGAYTYAAEPGPAAFSYLMENIYVNQIPDKVKALNVALGGEKGEVNFTASQDTLNHIAQKEEKDTIKVPIETLDDVLGIENIPSLIKIDVEGFETEVIRGAEKTLANNKLKAVIIELNYFVTRYGYDIKTTHDKFISLGFSPFNYDPAARSLTPIESIDSRNFIYIRDIEFVKNRVQQAAPFTIFGKRI